MKVLEPVGSQRPLGGFITNFLLTFTQLSIKKFGLTVQTWWIDIFISAGMQLFPYLPSPVPPSELI